ncbi:MAG TPA: DNA N-6-adenine-methyltransferase [Candidatus Latescibacteria bacterium]|nr:DNA N-6-adenine-methyltransferase [Candidatus Latescibacterota bacterium]
MQAYDGQQKLERTGNPTNMTDILTEAAPGSRYAPRAGCAVQGRLFGNMHGEGGKDEWLTPPDIIKALGGFDLDPASPINRPWPTASRHFTTEDDGLFKDWFGRVWLNPPYGDETAKWMNRLAAHGNGIALTFARTETKWFHSEVWHKADGVFFFRGRITFYNVDGTPAESGAGAPSCLVAYGAANVSAIDAATFDGILIPLGRAQHNTKIDGRGTL